MRDKPNYTFFGAFPTSEVHSVVSMRTISALVDFFMAEIRPLMSEAFRRVAFVAGLVTETPLLSRKALAVLERSLARPRAAPTASSVVPMS